MKFTYNNKTYMLAEMKEPNKITTYDMIAIFEIINPECIEEEYTFINYFYGADAPDEELINIAKQYIG